jgi:hypothetical protein
VEAKQQLGIPINRSENVCVPAALASVLQERGSLLASDVAPNLIALNIGCRDVLHRVCEELEALASGLLHDPLNGVFVESGQSGRRPDARAFQE